MLHKQRSKKTAILKYGLLVPLFGLMLVLSSATIRKNEQILQVADQLPIAETLKETAAEVPVLFETVTIDPPAAKPYREADLTPFYRHLVNKVRYPLFAQKNSIQGNLIVKMVIKGGKPISVDADTKVGGGCEEEVMGMIYAFEGFAAIPDGKYAVPVAFRLSGASTEIINENAPMPAGYITLKYIYISAAAPELKNIQITNVVKDGARLKITGSAVDTKSALIIVDGVKKENGEINDINPSTIDAISILRAPAAVDTYGPEAVNGVVVITTKPLTEVKVIGYPARPAIKAESIKREKNDDDDNGQDQDKQQDRVYDYVSIEKQPEFPGGIERFSQYLAKTVVYPKEAQSASKQGTVYVSFTVEKDGSLSDIRVDRKLGYGMDEEAIRVVKSSKKWNPGIQAGKPVRVKFNVPIKFALS